jgi:hypothetical protein
VNGFQSLDRVGCLAVVLLCRFHHFGDTGDAFLGLAGCFPDMPDL